MREACSKACGDEADTGSPGNSQAGEILKVDRCLESEIRSLFPKAIKNEQGKLQRLFKRIRGSHWDDGSVSKGAAA